MVYLIGFSYFKPCKLTLSDREYSQHLKLKVVTDDGIETFTENLSYKIKRLSTSDNLFFIYLAATLSANFFPTLNFTTFLAAILISFPVCGFLPFLAALFWTPKVPHPTNCTGFPLTKVFSTVSNESVY